MFRNKYLNLLPLFVLLVAVFVWTNSDKKEVHYHAGFKVFVNGVQEDFGQFKYMEDKPCVVDESKRPPEDPQQAKAHLHDNVGDVVHIEHERGVWGDLFKNIGYGFPAGATISGYIAGNKIENILTYPIKADDSVIIVAGEPGGANLGDYVSLDHIKEIEQKSESCGVN